MYLFIGDIVYRFQNLVKWKGRLMNNPHRLGGKNEPKSIEVLGGRVRFRF